MTPFILFWVVLLLTIVVFIVDLNQKRQQFLTKR
jgi:hypothetical protein